MMYQEPEPQGAAFRMLLLWLSFLVFVFMGILAGGMGGVYVSFLVLQIFGSSVANLTGMGLVVVVMLLFIGIAVGLYGLALLWMLCARPFFTGNEVGSVVFFGPTWFPERWLFRKLYPEEAKKLRI